MPSKELELLENVELKLAMSQTDTQLERCVNLFLAPVLLKLSSAHEQVRKKVMEILSHINKRVKPNKNIKLPLDALINQFTDDKVPMFVKNFTIIYLEMSIERLSLEEIAVHIPNLIRGISRRPTPQRTTIFHMILPALRKWKMEPGEQKEARISVFQFDKNPQDISVCLGFFLDIMLYQPLSSRALKEQQKMDEGASGTSAAGYPGLSQAAVDGVTNKGKVSWSPAKLADVKLGILNFTLTHIFTGNERLRILLAGACDANHEVVSSSEDGLRRWTVDVDFENTALIQSLYLLYLGTPTSSNVAAQDRRLPATNPLKIRVLQYLSKSIAATNMPAYMVQVIFDGIYGQSSNVKLRRSTMGFLQWTARMCTPSKIEPVAQIIISGLIKYIDQNPEVSGPDAESIKGYAYVGCGLIAKKVPRLALEDTHILSLFFDNLEMEQTNVRVYVQDALSSMIDIYALLPETSPIYGQVKEIILNAVQKNNSHSRYMALKYANAVYPYSSVFARYVCLLGSTSSVGKLEVKEESARGLRPFIHKEGGYVSTTTQDAVPASALPKFQELIEYIIDNRPNEEYFYNSKTPVISGFPEEVYSEILRFLRMIMVLEANSSTIVIDDNVEEKVDNSMMNDPEITANVKKFINAYWDGGEIENRRALEKWLHLIEKSLNMDLKDSVLLATSAKCLFEIISLGPSSVATSFKSRLDYFQKFTLSEKQDARSLMSHIFGILASDDAVEDSYLEQILSNYCAILEKPDTTHHAGGDIDRSHGAILSIGYLIGRCNYRCRQLPENLVQRCIKCLVSRLEGSPSAAYTLLAAASCRALSEIGRSKMFPLPVDDKKQYYKVDEDKNAGAMETDADNSDSSSGLLTIRHILERLSRLIKASKEPKIQEHAIAALGHLSIPLKHQANDDLMEIVTNTLFWTADTKQVELYFAGGEAWSIYAFGWDSQAMQKHKDISDMRILETSDKSTIGNVNDADIQKIIENVVKKYVTSDRSWYRKASCIWLLSILKFGKDQNVIKANLEILHASFSRLIGDRDDFTQEAASKGLGLVYEYGDSRIKQDMLHSLVGTFTEGRSIQAQSITDNTVLFEEGALGTTPDGNSITTYKELCSLASELNQPDLIYKFMNLANHNAMWTSRRGAAFGFQNLMSIAEKELEPYLPRLVPKLFRYQFDPNPRVNQTMKTIWQSLVRDNQKAVDRYFSEIMEDVLAGFGNRQWRVREASCAAVTDLVQGRQLAQIEPYLERLWTMSFRGLDDIKESVRLAATQTCKSLTKLTVHYCDPTVVSVADGSKVIAIVMPFLLEKGIVSDAEDVRKFSLDALLRICKTGASLLKPYVPDLVDTLLQALSSMEPRALNYLTFHAEKYNITQEQLDNARLSGAKNSPMMEGIEQCINQIDEQVMQTLAPRIIHIIKKGTGLPTKAGCARFIVTLCMNRRLVFEPYADSFLKALSGAIRSKNPVIRKSFATATGYVCQLASIEKLESLSKHLIKLYVEESDEDAHAASAVTMVEMTRFATDRMNAIASAIVPLIYYGEHDPDDSISKLWKDAWENLTSGTRSLVALHVEEIIDFVQPLLSSQYWQTKQTAALTIADMCKASGEGVGERADKLMPVMVTTLATRSWAGKENVLQAFVKLCISAPGYFAKPNCKVPLSETLKIVIREAKRNNRVYQRHALVSLREYADAFADKLDIYSNVHEFLEDLCTMDESDAMEEDDNDNAKPLLLMIKGNAFKALVSSFQPKHFAAQNENMGALCDILTGSLASNVWNVQIAILESIGVFLDRSVPGNLGPDAAKKIVDSCILCLEDMKYSAIRTAAIGILEDTTKYCTFDDALKASLTEKLQSLLSKEPLPPIQEHMHKVLNLLRQ